MQPLPAHADARAATQSRSSTISYQPPLNLKSVNVSNESSRVNIPEPRFSLKTQRMSQMYNQSIYHD